MFMIGILTGVVGGLIAVEAVFCKNERWLKIGIVVCALGVFLVATSPIAS